MSDEMTAQEVFTQAVRGVLRQGKRAVTRGGRKLRMVYSGGVVREASAPLRNVGFGRYRLSEGDLRCPVGHMLGAGEYSRELEGKSVRDLFESGRLPARLEPHVALLEALQVAHDNEWGGDSEWVNESDDARQLRWFKTRCAFIARDFGLTMPSAPQ